MPLYGKEESFLPLIPFLTSLHSLVAWCGIIFITSFSFGSSLFISTLFFQKIGIQILPKTMNWIQTVLLSSLLFVVSQKFHHQFKPSTLSPFRSIWEKKLHSRRQQIPFWLTLLPNWVKSGFERRKSVVFLFFAFPPKKSISLRRILFQCVQPPSSISSFNQIDWIFYPESLD